MNKQALTLRAYEEPDRYVLTLGGDLDMSGAPAFEAAAERLCALGARDLLVDITEVGFIDSMGVRAILATKASCEQRSCEFSMTHGTGHVDRLFELTALVKRLPFRHRREQQPRREIDLGELSER